MGWTRFFRRAARARERAREIEAHIALYVDELVAQGDSPDDARRLARLKFGNPRARLEALDDLNRVPVLDVIGRDAWFAVRMLRRSLGFTVTAVATLALVIGACAAIYSLASALLLRPLPYPQPDRLALVHSHIVTAFGEYSDIWQDGATWAAIRDGVRAADAATYIAGASGTNLVFDDTAAFVERQRVGAGFFRVLGVAPLVGREFSEDEDRAGGPAAAVLAFDLWQRLFDGDPDVVGRRILLLGEPHTVVGVMPEGFVGLADAEVWTPLRPSTTGEGAGENYLILVRLPDGVAVERVEAEMSPLVTDAFRRRRAMVEDDARGELSLQPLQPILTEDVRRPIVLLGAAVAAVLLIACVNLAALLLARGGNRVKEIATRMAIGAGRAVVIRQLMIEALVLAAIGGAVGLLVGGFTLKGLQIVGGPTYGSWTDVTMNGGVLIAAACLSLATSVIFGLAPAVQASRIDVAAALASGGSRHMTGAARPWLRRALVVAEVALGVTLLVSAGLLLRTFVNLQQLDPGLDPRGLMTTSVSLDDARYRDRDAVNELFDRTLADLRATPGIAAASVSLETPYRRLLNIGFRFVEEQDGRTANMTYVTPGFLETWRLPLLAGRDLGPDDTEESPPVVLVNDAFARIYSPDRDPVGRVIRLSGTERRIVGVTKDVRQRQSFSVEGVTSGPLVAAPLIFVPARQMSSAALNLFHTWFRPVWSVRASTPDTADAAVRRAIGRLDPLLPVAAVTSMEAVRAESTAESRLLMTLVGVLAVVAVLLAAIGIHGVIAQAIGERRRELGVRLALGATPGRTMRDVVLGGIALAAVGGVLGAGLSLLTLGLVRSFLWGVGGHDAVTYAGAGGVVLVVAAVASLLPATRILRLDPVRVLREG